MDDLWQDFCVSGKVSVALFEEFKNLSTKWWKLVLASIVGRNLSRQTGELSPLDALVKTMLFDEKVKAVKRSAWRNSGRNQKHCHLVLCLSQSSKYKSSSITSSMSNSSRLKTLDEQKFQILQSRNGLEKEDIKKMRNKLERFEYEKSLFDISLKLTMNLDMLALTYRVFCRLLFEIRAWIVVDATIPHCH